MKALEETLQKGLPTEQVIESVVYKEYHIERMKELSRPDDVKEVIIRSKALALKKEAKLHMSKMMTRGETSFNPT